MTNREAQPEPAPAPPDEPPAPEPSAAAPEPAAPLDTNHTDLTREELGEIFTNDAYTDKQRDQCAQTYWNNSDVLKYINALLLLKGQRGSPLSNRVSDRLDELLVPPPPAPPAPGSKAYYEAFSSTNLILMVTYPDRQLPHGRPAEDLIIVRNILAERNVSLKPPKAEAPPEKPAAPLDINRTDFTKEELEEIFTNKWYSKDQNLQILIRNHWGNKRVLGIILINLEPYTVMRRYVEDRVTYFDTCFFPNCPYKRIPWRYTYGDKMNNENERP